MSYAEVEYRDQETGVRISLPSLQTKTKFDKLEGTEMRKPESVNSGYIIKNDSVHESVMMKVDNLIIPDTPNSYKRRGVSLAKNFIQLSRSEETFDLLQSDPKAFLLLSWISLRAHREFDPISQLEEGECFVSEKTTPKECGLTPKEYRCAKIRLIKEGFLKEIFSPSWLRSKNAEQKQNIEFFKKRAMKRATVCCIVKLCNKEVYDINIKLNGDEKGDERAMKGRWKGDRQEREERKEYKKKTTPLPPEGGESGVSFSNKKEEKEKLLVHRDVFLSPKELEECIQVRGNLEQVKSVIDNILDWPDRKYKIQAWSKNIKTWTIKNLFVDKRMEHEQLGRTLESQFSNIQTGWSIRHYRIKDKDDAGVLFECHGSANSSTIFISYSDQNFTQQVQQTMRDKKMTTRKNT